MFLKLFLNKRVQSSQTGSFYLFNGQTFRISLHGVLGSLSMSNQRIHFRVLILSLLILLNHIDIKKKYCYPDVFAIYFLPPLYWSRYQAEAIIAGESLALAVFILRNRMPFTSYCILTSPRRSYKKCWRSREEIPWCPALWQHANG